MAALINGYAAQGLMLPKSEAELCRFFREYVVLTDKSGAIVGCAGLRVYRPELAEIIGLAVSPEWQGKGLGGVLVDRLVGQARGLSIGRVFAMALTPGVFGSRGFRVVARETVPEKVAADCRGCDRRIGCREITMLLDLNAAAVALMPPTERAKKTAGPRRLRVINNDVDIMQQ
jgi:amino-acid N-acetyltransferase